MKTTVRLTDRSSVDGVARQVDTTMTPIMLTRTDTTDPVNAGERVF